MEHHFNIEVAKEHGVDIAIFLQNLAFWTLKNVANKSHFIDGRYWIYNTQEAWTTLFPYWTRQNIRTIINKATEKNLIVKGNYNEKNYDKTTWYSLSDKCLDLFPTLKSAVEKSVETLGWNQPRVVDNSDLSTDPWLESTNGLVGINQPIPDNKPDNKHKSFCATAQKKPKSGKTKADWRKENNTRPEWADSKDNVAASKKQMDREATYIAENEAYKKAAMPDYIREQFKALKC